MTVIIFAIIIFLDLIIYLVIFDIILSWLALLGLRFRPRFIGDVLGPIYSSVRKYIPTRFGAFDFTPIVIILTIQFVRGLLLINFPGVNDLIAQLIR